MNVNHQSLLAFSRLKSGSQKFASELLGRSLQQTAPWRQVDGGFAGKRMALQGTLPREEDQSLLEPASNKPVKDEDAKARLRTYEGGAYIGSYVRATAARDADFLLTFTT
jgi:hypothetical protein